MKSTRATLQLSLAAPLYLLSVCARDSLAPAAYHSLSLLKHKAECSSWVSCDGIVALTYPSWGEFVWSAWALGVAEA
jgi:hypothetical protein